MSIITKKDFEVLVKDIQDSADVFTTDLFLNYPSVSKGIVNIEGDLTSDTLRKIATYLDVKAGKIKVVDNISTEGLDPRDPNLTEDQKVAIVERCKVDAAYFYSIIQLSDADIHAASFVRKHLTPYAIAKYTTKQDNEEMGQ